MAQNERQKWTQELRQRTGASDRNWALAVLLSALFGFLGADRFYLGYVESALLKLLTLGGLGLWWFWDFILLVTGSLPDADGFRLKREVRVTPGLVAMALLIGAAAIIVLISVAMSS